MFDPERGMRLKTLRKPCAQNPLYDLEPGLCPGHGTVQAGQRFPLPVLRCPARVTSLQVAGSTPAGSIPEWEGGLYENNEKR